jgi:flagellar biosynthetic protein FliS
MIQNIEAYRRSFETVEKTKQVVLLYDTAISSLYQAKTAIEANDFQERYNNLERAFLIMSGLKNCLDHVSAPELSGTLHDWYSAIEMKVLNINNSNSIQECETCISHLRKMREAWIDVDATTSSESASAQQAHYNANATSAEGNESSSDDEASSAEGKKGFDEPIMASGAYAGSSFSLSA